jgi:hypothetical protein
MSLKISAPRKLLAGIPPKMTSFLRVQMLQLDPSEDDIISKSPNAPARNNDYFHEKRNTQLQFGAMKNL